MKVQIPNEKNMMFEMKKMMFEMKIKMKKIIILMISSPWLAKNVILVTLFLGSQVSSSHKSPLVM